MNMKKLLFLFLVVTTFGIRISAQESDTIPKGDNIILPILFYLPETSLGASLTGVYTFRFDGEPIESRPSQLIYSAVYTLKNQILLLAPFEFWRKNESQRIEGEVGFFKYFYNFYGIGPESQEGDLENFDVIFPRAEFTFAQKTIGQTFLGAGMKYDYFNITNTDSLGLLSQGVVTGQTGGHKLNFVLLALRDSRDNIYAPTRGIYAEVKFLKAFNKIISDYDYSKWEVDLRYFFEPIKKYVVASQLWYSKASSGTPFFDLPYVSTPTFARGLNDRRYINYDLLNLQSELRYPIYKKFKGAAFLSSSFIPLESENLFSRSPIWSYGVGLRYEVDPVDKVRFRLDLALGGGEFNLYFTLNEAF